ncbi:hypothetical protein HBI56_061630 [Parastagonospora nodorum]|nr:hypothetical protein HBI09_083260 [Parastagonospora nodorum]KAH4294671.1 hypothetical protein HBI01_160000 [Parastagonospora nodorum]KAH4307449.1 hypothetical protein HBI02_111410 [Parastagonospora nodorum]KAH4325235.1 hypothetical protein HBI00_154420 [Parastagonospora nodorum]KAH4347414.1 hypothetical protein HBH98_093160 [Parastagonospora nodorum]
MPRLGHKKSRLGCRQCKARHVKCDELNPCSNCARHSVPCSLVTWDPSAPQLSSASTPSDSSNAPKHMNEVSEDPPEPTIISTPSLSVQNDPVPSQPKVAQEESNCTVSEGSSPSSQADQFPFLSTFIHRNEQTQPNLWVRDLELMHHWTVKAFEELSPREDIRHVWRDLAPQHAIAHPFFIHEILAFSALHKAHVSPEQRAQYYAYGIYHQDLSIRGVREKLRDVTPYEAPSIVATSTLLTLSVFASTGFEMNYPEIPSSQGAIDGILNVFNLMQGMSNVLAVTKAHIVNSFIAPIYRELSDPIPSQPMLDEVLQRLPALTSFVESKSDLSELERSVYLVAIASMRPCLQMAQSPCADNRELRFLFFWPMSLHPDFLNLVRQRSAGALAIQLMKACFEKLNPDWHPIVSWPRSFLNQTPDWNLFQSIIHPRHEPGVPLVTLIAQKFAHSNAESS